jgi:hypothetical protein
MLEVRQDANTEISAMTMQKWGGLASFLLTVTFIVPPWIYLVGDLRAAIGPFAYALADFLFGPVCAASLVMALVALRERIGERAPRQMSLALLAAALAAAMFVAAAFFRSANRQYLIRPELSDDLSTTLLLAWGTIVAGVIATGWHFLGWALVLAGSAGWASRSLPRGLSALYFVAGTLSLFVYMLPDMEGVAVLLGMVVGIWQGIVLWKSAPGETYVSERSVSQPEQA